MESAVIIKVSHLPADKTDMKTIVLLARNIQNRFSGRGRRKASRISSYDEAFIGYEAFSSVTSAQPRPHAEEKGKGHKEHLETEWSRET